MLCRLHFGLENQLNFLLGPSSKSNTALTAIQKEQDKSRIGRDLEPQFQHFSTPEAAAVRYICMACEVLGPRGDEKSGCRDAWIAFCALNEKPSVISIFKANGFNNWDDIITFLRDYMPDKNSKPQCPGWCHQWPGCCLPTDSSLVVLQTDWAVLEASRVPKHIILIFTSMRMKDQFDQWSQNASTIFDAVATNLCTANARLCILQGCHPSCRNNKPADHQHLPVTVWGADHHGGSTAERLSASWMLPCSHWSSNATEACPFPDDKSAGGACFGDLDLSTKDEMHPVTNMPA